MTEKRFKLYEHKDHDYILDDPDEHLDFIEMLGDALIPEEIVDLLNNQHEQIQSQVIVIQGYQERCDEVFKENKQLKQQLNRQDEIIKAKREEVQFHVDGYNQVIQTIKEAYKTERTEIGKSVLKQLLEAIK